MRIEFQYGLGEWIEWKRASLTEVRHFFLKVAEASLMPLFFLSALSLIIVLLRRLNVATAITQRISSWVPFVFVVVLAIAEIYLLRLHAIRKKVLKKEWQERIAGQKYRLNLTEDGVDFHNSTGPIHKVQWNDFTAVFQTKRLLMLCKGDRPDVLAIPKRSLGSREGLEGFLELAHRKTVLERNSAESPKSN